MNDFEGLLTSDYGFKPQGKSAPMKPSGSRSSRNVSTSFDSDSVLFSSKPSKSSNVDDFGDIFGANSEGVGKSGADSGFDFDSMFESSSQSKSSSSLPVFDKPVYDDDIFDGIPGMKSSSSSGGVKYDNVFASFSGSRSGSGSPQKKQSGSSGGGAEFDDLLGGFGKRESEPKSGKEDRSAPVFDDLIPGFGRATSPNESKQVSEPSWSSEPVSSSKKMTDDPFGSLGSTSQRSTPSYSTAGADPLEEFSKLGKSEGLRSNGPSVSSGTVYDDLDPFDGLGRSYSSERSSSVKDRSPLKTESSTSGRDTYNNNEQVDKNFVSSPESENHVKKKFSADNEFQSHQAFFGVPQHKKSSSAGQTASYHEKTTFDEADIPVDSSPKFDENIESSDEVWLTVAEIPLFTQPTSAPPPSRPPPPRPARVPKSSSLGAKNFESPKVPPVARNSVTSSSMDEFVDFAMGGNRNHVDRANGFSSEDLGMNLDAAASAAAMKEAMDRAEAKFRHAKEVRERESSKAARSREAMQVEVDENLGDDFSQQDRLHHEQLQRERERQEEERERRRLEKEREREEKEREQRRLERERARAREEREKARQAVERATREARERAAAEARLKAERAAVEKANAEARERAERTAVLRAHAEARERAAAEAKERAEKAAAEAREREARERAAETRMKAERAAVERAAAEARERAAAEAREKAAASARANQQRNDNDLESFFNTRANSAPRPRNNASDPVFDTQSQGRRGSGAAKTSDTTPSSMRKASSTTNIVDDLSSIFGGVPSSGEFQEVEGESEERRRARLERHQRTQERAAKALAEKNQRDLQAQREQAERHRIAESMDIEIKRWAAGKEGNLRALLSTLQYVLWPECGWQPVSLTDLITAASVKKVYRKATLCIHPDKVQQKGANLQQKCIAEKVFDLLKEAWNKFNSEELF